MTSFYGSVNGGQGGGGGEGIDTSTLLQKNDPTFNGTITGPNAHFTGTVQIPEPTEDNHAATKAYVDAALADVDLSEVTTRIDAIETTQDELAAQLDDKVDAENPAFTGTATLNGKNIATIDQIPNVSDLPYLDENNPTYTGTLTGENAAFSGTVTVATPAAEGEAANKGYVDSAKTELEGDISTLQQTVNTINQQVTNITSGTEELPYLKNTGDSGTGVYDFTGATVNAADPVDNSNVATKHYVDQKVASAGGAGEIVSYTQGDGISISPENEISLSIDSAGANGLKVGTNGLGLDLATSTTPGAMAASDKTAIASNTTEITNIKNGTTELPYLKETNPTYEGTLIGGDATFTGSVQISTPDKDNEAANKSYVDTALAEAKSYTDDAVSGIASDETIQQIQTDIENIENGTTELPYIKNNGDTVTGNYNLTGAAVTIAAPAADNNPATKKYVDDSISAIDVSEQISPLTERVTAAEGEIDTLQTNVEEVDTSVTNIINGTTELPYIKDNGDTVNGDYTFNGKVNVNKPTENSNVTNKEYVDNTYNDISTLRNLYAEGKIIIFTEEGKPLNLKLYGYSWFNGVNSYCNISKKEGETFQLTFHTGDEDKYIQLPDSLVLNGIDTRYMSDYDDQENAILNYKPIYFSADSNGEELDNFEIIADEYDFSTGKYIKKIGVIDSYNGEDLSKTVYTTYSIQNHTSEIAQTGETVFYLLNEPVETDIPQEIMGAYNQLQFHKGNTSLQLQGMMYSSIDFIYTPIEITFKIDKTNPCNNHFSANRYDESNTTYIYGNPDAVFMMPDIYAENATIHDFFVEDDIYIYHNSRLSDYRYRIEGKSSDRGLKFTIQDDGGRDDLITLEIADPIYDNQAATKGYVDEAINKFYHVQVLAATSKDQVDNLFASWWKTKWIEGVTTYNSMLEDWFANVLYDDRVHGVKLPLWETSHSQYGEFTDDSIGLTCEVSTEDYAGRDDFAYLPQFWCVEVAVEKNADYTHTIYACEFIDDINVVRAGGPNDGKHLVWVLQKNTYRREWEEEGYKYLKTRCTPAEGYTTWLQGTDNSGRVYPYVGIPKYAAGIESDGTIGSRAGLKPAIFESYDSGIQKWRARGSQYTGGSYLTLKWQLDMIALKYASKGNSNGIEGCVGFNIQTPVLVAESNANRVIINQDQVNNFMVGQYINIGSGDRLVSETNVLITNIETVNISETNYLALTFEGNPIETTTAQKVCSLAWPANLITNLIQGNDVQAIKGQTVTGLIQKTEFLNGAYLITSDEKWKWDASSNHEDGSRTFECYICEDASNITTGNSLENYTLTASINLPADYNNTNKYITDIVTTDKQIVFPKAISNEASSTTGYCDCMWIYFADNAIRAPWHCGSLQHWSGAGLAQLASDLGSSISYWHGGVSAPGLAK